VEGGIRKLGRGEPKYKKYNVTSLETLKSQLKTQYLNNHKAAMTLNSSTVPFPLASAEKRRYLKIRLTVIINY